MKNKQEELRNWFATRGDVTLRLDYNLNKNSVVFDLGGYMGQWSKQIFDRYNCNIFVFEPIQQFYNQIKNNVVNEKINAYHIGLSNRTYDETIYIANDGSSIYQKNNNPENIKMVDVCEFIDENNIQKIDLIKINVEGEEYNILETLISNDKIKDIDNIQVQFHDFLPEFVGRRDKIREELSKTHKETYCYEFVWENWKKIE